ncbi:FtsX-like permease family protein [Flavobacterium agricola]|uniref:FtsX-like permease family protein n=1 Tax=Flavobacterium agricola TaxID=2870839 RepID=A0ABY6LWB6_9FLAO|nr:FtsX-like permease family protein [Flavobacterium agricola]UYW00622.1 FtsX-like permease family protein [Flavobacterium agricola]
MKLEYFIAQRLIKAKSNKSNVSGPIIKIAITAIVISMIMMIVSVATGIGLQEKIREKIGAFHGHIIISNFDNNNSEVSISPITVSDNLYDYVKEMDGISHVQAVASTGGIIRTEDAFEGIILKGVDKNFYWDQLQEYVVAGKLPQFSENISNDIAISEFLANRLNLKVGDAFNTFFLRDSAEKLPFSRRFTIAAIYNSGLADYDASYIIGDIRHVQRFNKWKENQVGNLEVFVTDFKKIDEIGDAVYTEIPATYNSYTIVQKFPNIFEWLELLDFNIIGIIFFMILISAVNMIVALLVLILERTQMIGILKALGASNWTIRKIFLYNAAYLIIIGLSIGNAIGIGLIYIQKYGKVVTLNPESYYVKYAPVHIDWLQIAALNVGTIVICLLILLIPSYIITKIAPSKAIKFQ